MHVRHRKDRITHGGAPILLVSTSSRLALFTLLHREKACTPFTSSEKACTLDERLPWHSMQHGSRCHTNWWTSIQTESRLIGLLQIWLPLLADANVGSSAPENGKRFHSQLKSDNLNVTCF